jgi:hypothetical protein
MASSNGQSQKEHAPGAWFRSYTRTTRIAHIEEPMKIWTRRCLSIVALVGAVAVVTAAFAKHQHHNGQQLLGTKLNTNGKHDLHKVGDHTVSVHVENKKVAGVTVAHRTKGNVAVKKYKTSKKMAQDSNLDFAADHPGLIQPASYHLAQLATVYIGYAFFDGVDEYIYWFPADVIVDPLTGAVEYVPAP